MNPYPAEDYDMYEDLPDRCLECGDMLPDGQILMICWHCWDFWEWEDRQRPFEEVTADAE